MGLMASMGPTFGYPQMMISRVVTGRKGNTPFALANWISTVGWFTVNIILGAYALQLAFGLPFYVAAILIILVDILLAVYGHDIIHLFERLMSVVLAAMFTRHNNRLLKDGDSAAHLSGISYIQFVLLGPGGSSPSLHIL